MTFHRTEQPVEKDVTQGDLQKRVDRFLGLAMTVSCTVEEREGDRFIILVYADDASLTAARKRGITVAELYKEWKAQQQSGIAKTDDGDEQEGR